MIKAVFVSRHEMSEAQIKGLRDHLRLTSETELVVVAENITFSATENYEEDIKANKEVLVRLIGEYDVVTGVFPPVALEALQELRHELLDNPALGNVEDTGVLTPVSRQRAEERADGTKQIVFEHVRFACL